MSRWIQTVIQFTGTRPTADEAARLHEVLRAVDADAPELGPGGVSARWSSPVVTLEQVCDFLHFAGFPCRGRAWDVERQREPSEWHESRPTLDGIEDLPVVAGLLVARGFARVVSVRSAETAGPACRLDATQVPRLVEELQCLRQLLSRSDRPVYLPAQDLVAAWEAAPPQAHESACAAFAALKRAIDEALRRVP
jgi:hypothetical protein